MIVPFRTSNPSDPRSAKPSTNSSTMSSSLLHQRALRIANMYQVLVLVAPSRAVYLMDINERFIERALTMLGYDLPPKQH